MSDSMSSVPAVSGPPMTFPVPPVTPVVGKPMPFTGSGEQPTRSSTPQGVGQRLDIFV